MIKINLKVWYSVQPVQLSLHVRNDLNGDDGGNIGVGIYPNAASSQPSPCDISDAYEGDRLNFAAYDNQNVNGKTWFFNDNELPNYKSDWKEQIGSTITSINNNASFTTNTLQSGDNNATFIAYLKTTSYTTSGTMSASEDWISNNTLTDDITIPPGVTLIIRPGVAVNLNSHSLKSTGGTIDNYGSIYNYSAYVTSGSTTIGYCNTIQSAVNFASSGNEVHVLSGSYSGNISISGKNNLTLVGAGYSQTYINGTVSASSLSGLVLNNFSCNGVSLSSCTDPNVTVYMYGSGSGTGISIYNCSYFQLGGNNIISGFGSGLSANYSTGQVNSWAEITNNGTAVAASDNSSIYPYYSEFCGSSSYDLSASYGAYILAQNCYYNNGTPRTYTNGGYIDISGAINCSNLKMVAGNTKDTQPVLQKIQQPDGDIILSDFKKLNASYFDLSKRISEDIKTNGKFDRSKYSNEYSQVINGVKDFINKNYSSPLAGTALITSVDCYKIQGDNEGLRKYLEEIIFDKTLKSYSGISGLAKKYMIDYYSNNKDYAKALSTADEILEEFKSDTSLVCNVLYQKGIIYQFSLNDKENAVNMYSTIIKNYPSGSLVDLANQQLNLLGSEIEKKQAVSITKTDNKLRSSNFLNPFNPSTTITYTLPEDGIVTIKIFNALGQEINTLINNFASKGSHSIAWNGQNGNGQKVTSGIYFYSINFNNKTLVKKMLLLK